MWYPPCPRVSFSPLTRPPAARSPGGHFAFACAHPFRWSFFFSSGIPTQGAFESTPPPALFFWCRGWGICGGGLSGASRPTHRCTQQRASTKRSNGACIRVGGGHQVSVYILVTHGGSCLVSAESLVSRACYLLCPYLPEEVRTRKETEDEEVRAAGRTCRTPRRLLATSVALVEGRAPALAPNSPVGLDNQSIPWCLCVQCRAASYQCLNISPPEVAATKRPFAHPPGRCQLRARWRPLRAYGSDTGR